MKQVTVVSARTGKKQTLETNASTWGELKTELNRNGVDTTNMAAMIRETYNSLEVADATLPVENFTLFLLAQKQKGGNGIDFNAIFTLASSVDGICNDLEQAQKSIGRIVETGKAFAQSAQTFGETMKDANDKIITMQNAVNRLVGTPVTQRIPVVKTVAESAVNMNVGDIVESLKSSAAPEPGVAAQDTEKSYVATAIAEKAKADVEVKAKKESLPISKPGGYAIDGYTNEDIEKMRADAKARGISVKCKTGKSHKSYNRDYAKAYLAAIHSDQTTVPPKTAKVEPKATPIPKTEEAKAPALPQSVK